MNIGLTGGIGCGKSTAGKLFEKHGWRRLDSDELVRKMLEQDIALHTACQARWGKDAVKPGQGVDRKFVASKVFNDESELRWWEEQVHPRVRKAWQGALSAEPKADWVVEIPLLFENDLDPQFDHSICVEAPESVQLARLAAKGLDRDQSLARIRNQMPVMDKARRADIVLSNAGSFDFLERQVKRASAMLRQLPLNS